MASLEKMVVEINVPGLDAIAAIIAHLKQRNDELDRALTAVQDISSQQLEEIRRLRKQVELANRSRGGYAGEEQE